MSKFRHPRLKDATLSLADGLVQIDSEGIFETSSEAQTAKAALMGWETISEPKKRRRRTPKKAAESGNNEG